MVVFCLVEHLSSLRKWELLFCTAHHLAQSRYLIRTFSHRVRGSLVFNLGTAFYSFLPQSFLFFWGGEKISMLGEALLVESLFAVSILSVFVYMIY